MLNASAASRARSSGLTPAQAPDLLEDSVVVGRVGDGRHPGGIAGRRAEQGSATDVDHLDGVGQPDELRSDLRRERRDVDDDEVDETDPVGLEVGELFRDVATGEDPGVDGRMERLDLAADERRDGGDVGDAVDLDALAGQELAGPVRGDELDAEVRQTTRECGDTVRDPRRTTALARGA